MGQTAVTDRRNKAAQGLQNAENVMEAGRLQHSLPRDAAATAISRNNLANGFGFT